MADGDDPPVPIDVPLPARHPLAIDEQPQRQVTASVASLSLGTLLATMSRSRIWRSASISAASMWTGAPLARNL